MPKITFINHPDTGKDEFIEKALDTLESVKYDLKLFLFPDAYDISIKDLLDYVDVDLDDYTLDDLDALASDIRQALSDAFCEYPLSIDYVTAGTFEDQDEGYIRYQIAWGGPSYEIRVYDSGMIEFVYLDWFIGVGFDVTDDEVFKKLADYLNGLPIEKGE